jgi:hypothetical protein
MTLRPGDRDIDIEADEILHRLSNQPDFPKARIRSPTPMR